MIWCIGGGHVWWFRYNHGEWGQKEGEIFHIGSVFSLPHAHMSVFLVRMFTCQYLSTNSAFVFSFDVFAPRLQGSQKRSCGHVSCLGVRPLNAAPSSSLWLSSILETPTAFYLFCCKNRHSNANNIQAITSDNQYKRGNSEQYAPVLDVMATCTCFYK